MKETKKKVISYVFTCDRCWLEVEIEDLDLSQAAPLPPGWRIITFSFPADDEGQESQLFADHFENEGTGEYCANCVRLIKRILGETCLENLTDEERQEVVKGPS